MTKVTPLDYSYESANKLLPKITLFYYFFFIFFLFFPQIVKVFCLLSHSFTFNISLLLHSDNALSPHLWFYSMKLSGAGGLYEKISEINFFFVSLS